MLMGTVRLHGPRAGPRRADRSSRGHLRVRRRALRDADRPPRVPAQLDGRDAGGDPPGRAAGADARTARGSGPRSSGCCGTVSRSDRRRASSRRAISRSHWIRCRSRRARSTHRQARRRHRRPGAGSATARASEMGRRSRPASCSFSWWRRSQASRGGRSVEPPAAEPRVVRLTLALPAGEELVSLRSAPRVAISPAGTDIAYVARAVEARGQIYLRAIDSLSATRARRHRNGQVSVLLSRRAVDRVLRGAEAEEGLSRVGHHADVVRRHSARDGSWAPDGTHLFRGDGSVRACRRYRPTADPRPR